MDMITKNITAAKQYLREALAHLDLYYGYNESGKRYLIQAARDGASHAYRRLFKAGVHMDNERKANHEQETHDNTERLDKQKGGE